MNWAKSRNIFLTGCMAAVTVTSLTAFGPSGCAGVGNYSGNLGGGDGGGAGGGGGQTNPIRSIAALDPLSVAASGPDLYLTVYGNGFSSSSAVQWNGLNLATTFVNAMQVFAVVPGGYRSRRFRAGHLHQCAIGMHANYHACVRGERWQPSEQRLAWCGD